MLAKANERADLLQHKLDEQHVTACKAVEEAQRCDRLRQDLERTTRAQAESKAQATVEAQLREIFHLADPHRRGIIDAGELLVLGRSVNPSSTPQKCRGLMDSRDTSCDGKVSADEFVQLVQKAMEGLSEPKRQKGMKALQSAAEGLAQKAEAETARKVAEARVKANKRADLLQHKLYEQDCTTRKALDEEQRHSSWLQQRNDSLQQDLEEKGRALAMAIERADLLQHKLNEKAWDPHTPRKELTALLHTAQRRCGRLQQELKEAPGPPIAAEAVADAKCRGEPAAFVECFDEAGAGVALGSGDVVKVDVEDTGGRHVSAWASKRAGGGYAVSYKPSGLAEHTVTVPANSASEWTITGQTWPPLLGWGHCDH